MAWIVTPLGALLVLVILRDVFHTLWHPTRHGGLSRVVMRTVWRVSAHRGSRWRPAGLAGPLGLVAVFAACARDHGHPRGRTALPSPGDTGDPERWVRNPCTEGDR
ncbi:hypothetical protein SNE510_64020 [Streptomyces sp. NE5-10]|nr:hypothetical protein SNE510_64020 [Streptomyces sp. NE5-10]